jgi:hypothetical protein
MCNFMIIDIQKAYLNWYLVKKILVNKSLPLDYKRTYQSFFLKLLDC